MLTKKTARIRFIKLEPFFIFLKWFVLSLLSDCHVFYRRLYGGSLLLQLNSKRVAVSFGQCLLKCCLNIFYYFQINTRVISWIMHAISFFPDKLSLFSTRIIYSLLMNKQRYAFRWLRHSAAFQGLLFPLSSTCNSIHVSVISSSVILSLKVDPHPLDRWLLT